MNAPKTRGAAIASNCRDCIYDSAATGTWREQVSVCPRTECPLWRFRPLSGNAPAWITSRNPADLPDGWTSLHHDEAIRRLRASIGDKANGCVVQANGQTRTTTPVQPHGGTPHSTVGTP